MNEMAMTTKTYFNAIDYENIAKIDVLPDDFLYDFEMFYHPRVGELIQQLNTSTGDAVADMLDPDFLERLEEPFVKGFFQSEYAMGPTVGVDTPEPVKRIDLEFGGPYANYNWELLFHIPVAVAVHLSKNQPFAEAQKWFHYVFDPTSTDTSVQPPSARCWKFLYFRKNPAAANIAKLLTLLSTPDKELVGDDVINKAMVHTAYNDSCARAFQPFVVGRALPSSFQYYVVMSYVENLIAWGDSLFAQMTIETVNEATLCYVLAGNLLGPRPEQVPAIGTTSAKSYNDLKKQWGTQDDLMGNAFVDLEGQFPFNIVTPASAAANAAAGSALFGMGRTLYFCVPPNAKLLGLWDLVEDRLRKIRHCENLQGQVQLMPLFDPPIDPGLLVKAAAAGLDLGTVISGLNQAPSPVRSLQLIGKALELCGEVRSLGSNLLSAIEKGDAEHLAQLRQNHEIALQTMMQNVRFLQWQQAQASTESLLRSRSTALERYKFYLRVLGTAPDQSNVPDAFTVDHGLELTEDNFADAFDALVGQYDRPIATQTLPQLQLAGGSSPAVASGASGSGQLYLNTNEDAELNTHMPTARDTRLASSVTDTVASVLALIPEIEVDLHWWGLGAHSKIFGGSKLSAVARIGAEILRTVAGFEQDQGSMAARTAGYQRRADDWMLQANLAARELSQLGRQLLGSLITEQAAYHEYTAAQAQVGQSQELLEFIQSKFTNEDLYTWMAGQISDIYYQYFRLALDTARKAEQTMKRELMRPELDATTYVQSTYWDSGHQGLLSGESLHLDVKRMELDYHNFNLRELELTRHVSLRQLDPLALLSLRTKKTCTVSIPEWLYDRDCPGHYMRRIKSVAVSIPSVVGPYTSVNCTLSLQSSSVRVSSMAPTTFAGYPQDQTKADSRFENYTGTIQSIVTSSGLSDSGMFETNLRDDRFLPFEGAGAISTWTLTLPEVPSFDYSTITDVILHVRYTARDGGVDLARRATDYLTKTVLPNGEPLALLVSLRHDFPTEWYEFTSGSQPFSATLTMNYFPYTVQGGTVKIVAGSSALINGADLSQKPLTLAGSLAQGGSITVQIPRADLNASVDNFLVVPYDVTGLP